MKLGELGEDRLLELLLPGLSVGKGVVAGAGDDVAVVQAPKGHDLLLLKTDCVVENIHFKSSADPVWIGWKAMMRPLSDFAAVSGIPRFALVTMVIGRQKHADWMKKIYRGLNRAAGRFRVSIVGGETSNTNGPVTLSIAVAGFVEKRRWISRRGGKVGDDLFVTGRLGATLKEKHLRFVPRIAESRWLTENFPVHAMMDLSDGLGADLPRLARASGVGFEIDEQSLPLAHGATISNAISDGEDYELLFAISRRDGKRLQKAWAKKFPRLRLTRIGCLTGKSDSTRRGGMRPRRLQRGYVHFQ